MNIIVKTLVTVSATVVPLVVAVPASAAESDVRLGADAPSPPSAAASAETDTPRLAFSIQPLSLLAKSAAFDLGIRLGENATLGLSGRYLHLDTDELQGHALGGGLGLEYYWVEAFRGLYVYPRVLWDHARFEKNDQALEGEVITPAVTAGYQWRWNPVTLRVGAGIGYAYAAMANRSTGRRETNGDAVPLFDIDLGVAF